MLFEKERKLRVLKIVVLEPILEPLFGENYLFSNWIYIKKKENLAEGPNYEWFYITDRVGSMYPLVPEPFERTSFIEKRPKVPSFKFEFY